MQCCFHIITVFQCDILSDSNMIVVHFKIASKAIFNLNNFVYPEKLLPKENVWEKWMINDLAAHCELSAVWLGKSPALLSASISLPGVAHCAVLWWLMTNNLPVKNHIHKGTNYPHLTCDVSQSTISSLSVHFLILSYWWLHFSDHSVLFIPLSFISTVIWSPIVQCVFWCVRQIWQSMNGD